MAWVSSWVSTTSRPAPERPAHGLRHDDDAVGPGPLARPSGPSVTAATPVRSAAPRPSRRAASASLPGASHTAGSARPHTEATRSAAAVVRRERSETSAVGAHDEEQGSGGALHPESLEVPRLRTVVQAART